MEKQALHRHAFDCPLGRIAVALATRCNIARKMCGEWRGDGVGLAHEKVLSLMEEARSMGATGFSSCWTEPFMREDTPEILAYAERIGFEEVLTVSNGACCMKGKGSRHWES
jgi:MoaA/NifB/PqqE/SkfB family radical SAM enzyme